ncbi:FG-GAP repeat protein [Herpetosiphon gulosus]|uniref:Integrin alpha beta-propellor repeat protein n=1 Tax=Herpetosiphon gulosus TaxID=1973496 RepID=A0ABP9X7X7_9CHLR
MGLSVCASRRLRRIVSIMLLAVVTMAGGVMSQPARPSLATAPLAAADWAAIQALLPLHQQVYLKASQASANDHLGYSVAVSGDTVVVGAYMDKSSLAGVQNSATPTVDTAANQAGAAYVFVRNGTTWSQQAYLKASQVSAGDLFGFSVAVAGDTIVVSAPYEDSSTMGVQNSATPTVDESTLGAGGAYVFVRNGTTWSQQAYLKASQVSGTDLFGFSVAVSGNLVVVGSPNEDSSTMGVQNSATPTVDEALLDAGAAYVFVRNGTTWSQQAYLKASQVSGTLLHGIVADRRLGEQAYLKASQVSGTDLFGASVAVSEETVVVGAYAEDSSLAGVQNSATPTVDETVADAGAAYVFGRSGTTWSQQAYLKASQVSASDFFGYSVAVSEETVVVGAYAEDSSTMGVQNSATPTVDESASGAGAAYVFGRSGTTWSQQAYLKASQVSMGDLFGYSVAVSGETVVVGAYAEDSSTMGVQNSATPTVDESASGAGAAYVFGRSGTTWSQQAYLKASQVSASDFFGYSVAVSGETLVVGAYHEDSSTAGIQHGALPTVDERAQGAGAVYGFTSHGLESRMQYLPLVATSQPQLIAALTTDGVPTTPVSTPGMIFLTTTITLPSGLPSGGHYWLSARPTTLVPGLVDDAVMLRVGPTEILRHHYGMTGELQAALVEVPASVLLPWTGQTVTVVFTDISGSVYSSTPLYLVWTP